MPLLSVVKYSLLDSAADNISPIICTFYDPKEYFGDYISIFLEI